MHEAELVKKLVRFVIFHCGNESPIKSSEIIKFLGGKSCCPNPQEVLNNANEILEQNYGLKLVLLEANPKSYIVLNCLSFVDEVRHLEDYSVCKGQNINRIFLLLCLTHIFMSEGSATEQSLSAFLRCFKLDLNSISSLFGHTKNVFAQLIKLKFLREEIEESTKVSTYFWGSRAEKLVSKRAILQFVSEIYGNRSPESWKRLTELAGQQAA